MPTASNMKGKAALVTGAASGLGRATAVALARAGSDPDPNGVGIIQFNAGQAWESLGELVGRRDFLRRELALTNPPGVTLVFDYAVAQQELDQPDSAAVWFQRALDDGDLLDDPRRCVAYLRLAEIARDAGRVAEAGRLEREAERLYPATQRSPWARGIVAAVHFRSPAVRDNPAERAQIIKQALDSLGYTAETKSRNLVQPLGAAASVLLDAGDYADGARYAEAVLRIAQVDSLSLTRSGLVGMGLVLQARAAAGQGHRVQARDLAVRALPPLTFGLGSDHPLTRRAVALADSLKTP